MTECCGFIRVKTRMVVKHNFLSGNYLTLRANQLNSVSLKILLRI